MANLKNSFKPTPWKLLLSLFPALVILTGFTLGYIQNSLPSLYPPPRSFWMAVDDIIQFFELLFILMAFPFWGILDNLGLIDKTIDYFRLPTPSGVLVSGLLYSVIIYFFLSLLSLGFNFIKKLFKNPTSP